MSLLMTQALVDVAAVRRVDEAGVIAHRDCHVADAAGAALEGVDPDSLRELGDCVAGAPEGALEVVEGVYYAPVGELAALLD